VVAVLAAGCDPYDGRLLPPPDPGAAVPPPAAAPPQPDPFELGSEAVGDDGVLDMAHTCWGQGTSPPLRWASTPAAAALAVVARDVTAGQTPGTVRWVVVGIDPAVAGFAAGSVPEGATLGPNETGQAGWLAPCPDPGTQLAFDVVLHALAEPVTVGLDQSGQDAAAQVERSSIATAVLSVVVHGPAAG
jgi:phosphatidylethanolamine-binding protein (PEBP) family uncharacterized protein